MMLDKKVTEFLDVLSSNEPVPGGGGASATAVSYTHLTLPTNSLV